MGQLYGYIRTSRALQEGVPGMEPASQELQLRRAGVPLGNIFRDVGVSGARERRGWHRLNSCLAGGDSLMDEQGTKVHSVGRYQAQGLGLPVGKGSCCRLGYFLSLPSVPRLDDLGI